MNLEGGEDVFSNLVQGIDDYPPRYIIQPLWL